MVLMVKIITNQSRPASEIGLQRNLWLRWFKIMRPGFDNNLTQNNLIAGQGL